MKKLCEECSIAFEDIQKTKEAGDARHNHKDTMLGVFLANQKLGRGYDLKLKKDALVIVLVNDDDMKEIQILQMFGRSSRR